MSKENNARPSLFDLGRQADSPECDLGGTMGTPGPASEIDPNQFLDRPDYSQIRWIESEPHRCALDRLQGKGPHTWVAEALGNDTFAGEVIFTQRDRRVVARSKSRPLASNGNIYRAKQSGEFAELIKDYAIQPGPVLRFAPDGHTSIRSSSMARVKIYQAHQHDPDLLAAEITRVCLPGARVTLVGLELFMALDNPRIETALGSLFGRAGDTPVTRRTPSSARVSGFSPGTRGFAVFAHGQTADGHVG
jgi:hypothetical protein